MHLDANEDEIAGNEARAGTTFVDAITVGLATIFDNESDCLASEVDVLSSMLDLVGEDRGAGVSKRAEGTGGIGGQSKVERKFELATHGRHATDNIRAVDGAAIPSIGGDHRSFDPN